MSGDLTGLCLYIQQPTIAKFSFQMVWTIWNPNFCHLKTDFPKCLVIKFVPYSTIQILSPYCTQIINSSYLSTVEYCCFICQVKFASPLASFAISKRTQHCLDILYENSGKCNVNCRKFSTNIFNRSIIIPWEKIIWKTGSHHSSINVGRMA